MTQTQILVAVIRLMAGCIGAFFAILLWPRTRDASWMAVIGGVIISYAGIVYELLVMFGILTGKELVVEGIAIIPLVLEVLPMLLFSLAFVIMIFRTRR